MQFCNFVLISQFLASLKLSCCHLGSAMSLGMFLGVIGNMNSQIKHIALEL